MMSGWVPLLTLMGFYACRQTMIELSLDSIALVTFRSSMRWSNSVDTKGKGAWPSAILPQ